MPVPGGQASKSKDRSESAGVAGVGQERSPRLLPARLEASLQSIESAAVDNPHIRCSAVSSHTSSTDPFGSANSGRTLE